MMDGMGPWMVGSMFLGLLLVAGFVGVIVYLAARASGGPRSSANASDVLRMRFAKGEIDRPEYEERLALLAGKTPPERPRA